MSDVADYDADILLWSERQAALLRALKDSPRGASASNELDLENVAEEIESVGRSELAAVESYLILVLVHVLKAVSAPKPLLTAKWRTEAVNFSQRARRQITPAMRQRIDMNGLWTDALENARAALAEYEDQLAAGLPDICPVSLDLLVTRPLDFDGLVGGVSASRDEANAEAP